MGSVKGDNAAARREKPQHQVDITRAVFMGRTPVTVAAYRRFAQATERVMPTAPEFNLGWKKEDHPIVNVSWEDAKTYCEWAGGRLPTEAEWEYTARGGKEGLKYPWGDEISEKPANYLGNVGGTSVVGSYPANDFGLYDMVGNVWEWVADVYDENYYSKSPKKNPQGPSRGDLRVLRGGSWSDGSGCLRASLRGRSLRDFGFLDIGFRCTREVFSP